MSRKLSAKRRELLNDPNWTEEFPRQDSPNQVNDGISVFCPCGQYHPKWFLEPKEAERLSDTKWIEVTICPESGYKYRTRPRPLMPATVRIPYDPS